MAHVEQVIASHAGLSRHASRDDHNVGALQGVGQLLLANVALRSSDHKVARQCWERALARRHD